MLKKLFCILYFFVPSLCFAVTTIGFVPQIVNAHIVNNTNRLWADHYDVSEVVTLVPADVNGSVSFGYIPYPPTGNNTFEVKFNVANNQKAKYVIWAHDDNIIDGDPVKPCEITFTTQNGVMTVNNVNILNQELYCELSGNPNDDTLTITINLGDA